MRHPLRRVATQSAWYAAGSALTKLSGFILLPVLTNTRFLSVADYGRWGIFEVTAQLAVAILGLSLPLGLVRFYAEEADARPGQAGRTLAATWWITVGAGAAAALLAAGALAAFVSPARQTVFAVLLAFVFFELLLGVPMAYFRSEERAGWYTGLFGSKLLFLVVLALWLMTRRGLGLLGLTSAAAGASALTLLLALAAAHRREFFLPQIERETSRRLLRFSVPLIIGGLGSMALNAGDRYVLVAFRGAEELAVYTLAGKFGGVVNMFVVQPFNLAWLPLLFRLQEGQRSQVLRLLVPYFTLTLCFVVVGLCLFAGPVLRLMGSAAPYAAAVPLMLWIGFGFAAFGLSLVFGGVLALYQQTRLLSFWLMAAALLNLGLNLLLVPRLGALAAALNTLIAYAVLLAGQYFSARKYLPVSYPWGRLAGLVAFSVGVSLLGTRIHLASFGADLAARAGLLLGWIACLIATRWLTLAEIREVWQVMRKRD